MTYTFREIVPYYKRNLKVAFPVMLTQLGAALVGLADSIMVGHYGTADLAAVSFSNAIFFTVMVFAMGAVMGITPLVGHVHGRLEKLLLQSAPDEEIALIGKVDLRTQAVVDARSVPGVTSTVPGGTIEMTSYTPNEVRYRYSTPQDRVAVFSEVFYTNGWTATVDGQPLNIFRADWTLRGALLPAGDHEVVMRFAPQSYKTGATVSLIASLLLLLMLVISLAFTVRGSALPKNGRF